MVACMNVDITSVFGVLALPTDERDASCSCVRTRPPGGSMLLATTRGPGPKIHDRAPRRPFPPQDFPKTVLDIFRNFSPETTRRFA